MLTIRAQFYYLRLFIDIENVSSRPLPRVEGGGHRLKIGKGGRYCLEKKVEKWPIFDQNHGLTPLEKSQFFDCLNVSFL